MTYRTGNHWGVTIVREGERTPEGHITGPDQLVAVVVNGDQALAERICALLNAEARLKAAVGLLEYALHLRQHGERAPGGDETWAEFDRRAETLLRSAATGDAHTPDVDHTRGAAEALAAIRRRLTHDGVLYPGDAMLLQDVAAELGVDGDAPPSTAERDVTTTPYRIFSRWVKAGDRSGRAVYTAIQEAYALGLSSDPPSAPAISPQAAQNGPAAPSVTPVTPDGAQ